MGCMWTGLQAKFPSWVQHHQTNLFEKLGSLRLSETIMHPLIAHKKNLNPTKPRNTASYSFLMPIKEFSKATKDQMTLQLTNKTTGIKLGEYLSLFCTLRPC